MSDYCNNFTDAIDEARRICRLCGVDPTFQDYVWKKKKRHFDELAEDTLDERRTALPNHGVQLRDWRGNIAANSVIHGNEQYRSKVFRYFPSVLSSAPEHDIVSQVTALRKEHNCDLSDAFPVQLSTTMHSLYTTMSCKQFWGVGTRDPDPRGPPALQGLQGRLLRHW